MQRHHRMVLLGIIGVSSLLWGMTWAQIAETSPPNTPQAPEHLSALTLPPSRPFHRRPQPSPSPRVEVYPIVPLSPFPASPTPSFQALEAVQGYLRLEIQPPDAEVYVDGHLIGRSRDFSKPAMVAVSPGGHLVEVRADDRRNLLRVFVTAGETVEIDQDLGLMHTEVPTPVLKRWTIPSRRQAHP